MKIKLYSIMDAKLATFGSIHQSLTDSAAVRQFADVIQDKNNFISKHPEDFSLYRIGEYDDETGNLIPSVPQALVTASSLLSNEPNEIPLENNGRAALVN